MATELRLSAARAFDRALTLSQLPTSHIRYELTCALRAEGEAPISRSALEDWRKGRQPVDLETVLAACKLAGATLTMHPDGGLSVHLEELGARPALRAATAGRMRASFSLMAGALALSAFVIAAAHGWFGLGVVVVEAARTAATVAAETVPGGPVPVIGVVYAKERHSSPSPSPSAGAGAGPRILASPTAAPASPSPAAVRASAQAEAGVSSPQTAATPSPAPQATIPPTPPPSPPLPLLPPVVGSLAAGAPPVPSPPAVPPLPVPSATP